MKLLRGNPGKRALNRLEPQPEHGQPICPDWIDADTKARWDELVPQLDAMGVLTRIDGDALVNYCQAWSRWKRAEQFIQTHGATMEVMGRDGQVFHKPYPQVRQADHLLTVLNRYQREFGLTPSARSTIKVQPGASAASLAFQEFVKRKRS